MNLLDLIIIVPLFGVLAIMVGMSARGAALAAAVVNLILSLIVFAKFDRAIEGLQFVIERPLIHNPHLSLTFGVDGMSLIMLLLSTIVTVAAIWMSPRDKDLGKQAKLYYISPLLISAGAIGAFLSTDLFFFFAFHELALIPTFIMIGMLGHGHDRVNVAWKITLYLSAGSMILLVGLLGVVVGLGGSTFDIAALQAMAAEGAHLSAGQEKWIAALLIVGFGILISLFPFHSWAAPAYAAAPTPVAMLHAGVLKKFGLYGLLRVVLPILPDGFAVWSDWLLILLLGNIIYIGLITISQSRLDRMIGYSSVMHMGYVFLGIVSYNAIGINGAILLMFAHGVSVALMFGLAGQMRQQLPMLDLYAMGGMGKTAPFACFMFALAAFASIGLPGFANFTSELLVFFGAFQGYGGGKLNLIQIATVLALWGVVISAVYALRAFRRVFQGEPVGDWKINDLPTGAKIASVMLVIVLLAIGIYPALFLDLLTANVEQIVGQR